MYHATPLSVSINCKPRNCDKFYSETIFGINIFFIEVQDNILYHFESADL